MFLDFYGLRQQPFGVTPDPAYLYPSRTHSEALSSLTAGISEGRGFFALVAEPGMGKTTLLYRMLEGLRESTRTAYLFQTQCDKREFLQYILSELGVDSRGLGLVSMHNKLNEVLFAELLEGRRFVLVVDEAQNLDDSVLETIRLLSNFETTHTKLLQIVLAGQPELAIKLAQPRLLQLRQRVAVYAHLRRFGPEETRAYVDHRLQLSGSSAGALFTPDALVAVAETTRGIPRNINNLCYRALSIGCERSIKPVTKEVVREASAKLGMELFADVLSTSSLPATVPAASSVNIAPPVPTVAAAAGVVNVTPREIVSAPVVMQTRVEAKPAAPQAFAYPAAGSQVIPVAAATSATSVTATSPPTAVSAGDASHYAATHQAFTYQGGENQRPGWIYPAAAIGILAVLAISIPTLLRLAGPGLARAASLTKASHATPPPPQAPAFSPEFGPANYAASPSDTGTGQVLTVVALPNQTLKDVVVQHGGLFDDETVKQLRALNPQMNPDQIQAGQLIRIPLPAGTWQKSFDTADTTPVKNPAQSKNVQAHVQGAAQGAAQPAAQQSKSAVAAKPATPAKMPVAAEPSAAAKSVPVAEKTPPPAP